MVDLCEELEVVMRIIGYVVLAIKIAVPIILIVIGMMDLAGAVMKKDDKEIKAAQTGLIRKAVAAVLVFLVFTLVTMLMTIIGSDEWQQCTKCINNPGQCTKLGDELPTK